MLQIPFTKDTSIISVVGIGMYAVCEITRFEDIGIKFGVLLADATIVEKKSRISKSGNLGCEFE